MKKSGRKPTGQRQRGKGKSNPNTQVVVVNATKKKNNRPRRTTNATALPNGGHYKMICDPCNARLVPGLYGSSSGLMASFHNFPDIYNMGAWNDNNFGYVIWYPSYHGSNTTGNNPNLFVWFSNSGSAQPGIGGFGLNMNGNTSSARSSPDPAWAFVHSATCADARTLGACMKLTYTGRLADTAGLIKPLTNIPISTLLRGGASGNPCSVNDLAQYSALTSRPGVDNEVKWRPIMDDVNFRPASGVITPDLGAAFVPPNVAHSEPMGIGFAFLNILGGTRFALECFKNVEWRPEPVSGLRLQTPVGADDPGFIRKVVDKLDKMEPHWQTKASQVITDLMANLALGGFRQYPMGRQAVANF